ncbi:MAG: aminotransferase class I/II-fold pyridoxal phosphate-dependent enzyme [Myroides sp.]|jgi:threonine aldolase|uniref:threonine aldolase family protein n=1 Tax=Myroides marinus TaxID=703342 RepID=UPI002574E2EE|nr:GntG family PLP-dependent aldolase [Myroides marinus]MDM1502946.1 aminotransferase class I/II-fold pyridoxal phosphate-dependent enzyme [Myroides marinus]MDR0194190.1 aminotransferase class I/II-fold pyridoxal phosphate-dependent enzyme [Myroides sp.]
MEINLISDTITKPTPEMLNYMMKARVGDDVYKQDGSTNELEIAVAELFGMEAALFFPSGTMANQVAIKLHTQPGDHLICDRSSHINMFEGGGVAVHSGVSCALIDGDRGRITAEQVLENYNDPNNIHLPLTKLVCIENTTNLGGGACYELNELERIREVCNEKGLKMHLDGARLWNALVAKSQHPSQFGALFNTISVCFSKGLGAPVGSVLLGSKEDIKKAIRLRKLMGGGMRQIGYLTSAALFALKNNVGRLQRDHFRAKQIEMVLNKKIWIDEVLPVQTNIVVFKLRDIAQNRVFIEKLKQKNISISDMGGGWLRMVTHLDYREVMHEYVMEALSKLEL